MKALVWRGEAKLGEDVRDRGHPRRPAAEKAERVPPQARRAASPRATTTLMEKYLEGEELTVDELQAGDPRAHHRRRGQPGAVRTAFKNKGVQPMLDAVDRLPPVAARRAADRRPRRRGDEESRVIREPDHDEPFSALAFKIASHPFFGKLTYIRVYSGTCRAGAQVINSTKGKKERIGKLFQMHSNKENPVDEALGRPHLRGHRPQGHDDRRHALRPGTTRSSSSR